MRHSKDTTRSGLGAFVARRTAPNAAENITLRRFRGRINAVAAAKGFWSRVFKNEKRSNDTDPSVSRIVPSINSALGVQTQMMNPISAPAREVNAVVEDWDVGLLPSSFPSDETLQSSFAGSFDMVAIEDATMLPLPLQSAEEVRQLEAESPSSIATDCSTATGTDPFLELISYPDTTAITMVTRSLSLFPRTHPTRALSPDGISAPIETRRSLDALAVGSRSGSELAYQPHSEIELLVNSIERFRFTTLVNTTVIDSVKNTRAKIIMTSSNLHSIGWDMKRLLVIWGRITLNAPDVSVLRVLQPWTRVPKEHVAKACRLMQRGLQTYRNWEAISNNAFVEAEEHSSISDKWWAMHHKKFKELDFVSNLDLDGAFAQVKLIVEKYLGFEKEVAIMRKPARPGGVTNTTGSSTAVSIVDRTVPSSDAGSVVESASSSSSESQRPIPASPTKDWSATFSQASCTSGSQPTSSLVSQYLEFRQPWAPSPSSSIPSSPKSLVNEDESPRYPKFHPPSLPLPLVAGQSSLKFPIKDGSRFPKIQQVSKPHPVASGPSTPQSPVKDVKRPAQTAANVPNYLRPTKASTRAIEPAGIVPSYMRPTKATRGAYTPPVKPAVKATLAPQSKRLEIAIHGKKAKRVPAEISARLMEVTPSSVPVEPAPPVPPKSARRMTPKDLPKLEMVGRSDYIHNPHVFKGTAPRSPPPLWNSSPPIYTSTRVLLRIGGLDPPRVLTTNSRGDGHGIDGEVKLDEETSCAPMLPPIEKQTDGPVEVESDETIKTIETARNFDEIRAKIFEMKMKLQAMKAKARDAVAEAKAEIEAAETQLTRAVDEQMRARKDDNCNLSVAVVERAEALDVDLPQAAASERPEATKYVDAEPRMPIIRQWEAEYDDITEDDDKDEDMWYDVSEVSVEDECP
ncbi:hypothetical protein G6011_08059 [Alternaria panax]|uniref:Uncharacterized protein n=1 Tax=Alternaria panax TaxID=48097 RepID=A0AAD4F8Y8_9PLEO|nr:hypothetical protein G6011_08059 [Alternaria panax]